MAVAQWIAFGTALLVMVVGVLGTILPALPGIPLIWLTMLVFGLVDKFQHIDGPFLGWLLAVAVAAEAADYWTRAIGARRYGARKAGARGAIIGGILGLFFLPLGLVLGPFLGALIGELLSGRSLDESVRAGWGGLLGTLGSMAVKFVIAVGMTIAFVVKVL